MAIFGEVKNFMQSGTTGPNFALPETDVVPTGQRLNGKFPFFSCQSYAAWLYGRGAR